VATSLRRRVLVWTGLAAALPVVTLALTYLAAAGWLRHERRAWVRDDPSGAEALGRLRTAEANETARRLIALAQPIGIELAVFRSSETDLRPTVAFVEEERHALADGGAEAPPAVGDLLLRQGAALDAIEGLLGRSDPPAWPFELSRFDTPDAPVLGLRDLNALLLARALQRDRAGDRDGVARALLASARLGESIHDRPEQLAQATAAWVTAARAGVLRRLPEPPAGWTERLGTHDFRASMRVSYQLEARQQMEYSRSRSFSWRDLAGSREPARAPGLASTIDRLLTTPHARWGASDSSRRLRRLAAELRRIEPCRVDPSAVDRSLEDLPRWNVVGRVTLPSAALRWRYVVDVELDEELTRVVLETRARAPARADAVPSRVCGGLVWNRTPEGSGGVTIEAGGVQLRARAGRSPWRYHVKWMAPRTPQR
jgi:hypothetical protein